MTRPDIEVLANVWPVSLPDALGLKKFRDRGVMILPLQSYEPVLLLFFQSLRLVVKVAL
jgi:hypothetical protein